MDIFVARQPIFDRNMNLFAYELLYRSGTENTYTGVDGDQATSNVIVNSFLVIGIETLSDGKLAFVNFTEQLLKSEVATLLPKESTVIEILETIFPSEDIVEKCQGLKTAGYTIALDDFVFAPEYMPLIKIADIIKVDFLLSQGNERKKVIKSVQSNKIKFLAEKVETEEDFKQALELGYSYFQGYFFSKPAIIQARDIPPYKLNYLQLINKIYQPEPEFDKIASIIEKDISLSMKILKLTNSAAFYLRNNITSIKHALVLLGIDEVRKLVSLVALKGISDDKPSELLKYALIRAKFCEGIASKAKLYDRRNELFILGMFSLADVMMSRPMEEILRDLPISRDIKDALINRSGNFLNIYELILSYEKGEWEKINAISKNMKISSKDVALLYYDSLIWADKTVSKRL